MPQKLLEIFSLPFKIVTLTIVGMPPWYKGWVQYGQKYWHSVISTYGGLNVA